MRPVKNRVMGRWCGYLSADCSHVVQLPLPSQKLHHNSVVLALWLTSYYFVVRQQQQQTRLTALVQDYLPILRQHPTSQFFTGRMPFLPHNQQRQSTEGKYLAMNYCVCCSVPSVL